MFDLRFGRCSVSTHPPASPITAVPWMQMRTYPEHDEGGGAVARPVCPAAVQYLTVQYLKDKACPGNIGGA